MRTGPLTLVTSRSPLAVRPVRDLILGLAHERLAERLVLRNVVSERIARGSHQTDRILAEHFDVRLRNDLGEELHALSEPVLRRLRIEAPRSVPLGPAK